MTLNFRRLAPNHRVRVLIIAILLILCVLALMARLIDLSIVNRRFLTLQHTERTLREMIIPAYRGIIADRNNQPLAISTPVYALWVDPKKQDFSPTDFEYKELLRLTHYSKNDIEKEIHKNNNRQFVYLERDISPAIANQIKALKIKGLYLEEQYQRFYPEGEVTAPLIGFTNIDDNGQEGLELLYNKILKGESGVKNVIKDRYGNVAVDLGTKKEPVSGQNILLSIDSRLQYIAYNALQKGVEEFGAQYGAVVILDIHTGEILAMASVPSFNPNMRPLKITAAHKNRAVTDIFEPGSTIKTFAMTSALMSGKFHVGSTVDTSPGYWTVEGKKIDDDGYNNGVIDLTRILQVSSNVGMSKVILNVPVHLFLNLLHDLGFAQPTDVHFPGENSGLINKNAVHSPFVYATVSFGYAISVNLLQLAHAYATLANDGTKIPVSLLKTDGQVQSSDQVISRHIASEIRSMLESVLQKGKGTGAHASVYNYRVTGKTGTTRMLGPHGYLKNAHNSYFVGIAPASSPQLVVAVMVHAPSKKAYLGGDVAGPIFSKVMGDSLRMLNVPPDNVATQT